MTHPGSSSWLLFTLLVLLTLAIVELRFQAGTGSGRVSMGQGGPAVEVAPTPRFSIADRETYSETLARPLFMSDRRPPEPASSELPASKPQTARAKPNRYVLSAIVIVDNRRTALLTDTITGHVSRVSEGESLAGWQVEEIQEGSAVLSNGDTREELSLRIFATPAPGARGPAAEPTRSTAGGAGAAPVQPRRPKRERFQKPGTTAPRAN